MKTILTIILIIASISCNRKLLYIPRENVIVKGQDRMIILGTEPLPIVIEKAYLNPRNLYYTVYGYVDFLGVPDKKHAKYPNVKISIISNGDTMYLARTKKWGKFKFKMQNIDTALFNFDQYKILTIEAPYP